MKTNTDAQPLVFFNQPIVYVNDFDAVVRVVTKMTNVKGFVVIAESGSKTPAEVVKLGKERKIEVVRIRSSGSWNSLYRLMAEYEKKNYTGAALEAEDLMFISFHSAHDISAGLKRHRTFNKLTCRELYYLNTIDDLSVPLHAMEAALKAMPNVATSVNYGDLTIEQRFILTEFEFARYTRPVHCPESLELLFKAIPFYEQLPADQGSVKAA